MVGQGAIMKYPFPWWKYWLVFITLVMGIQGFEFMLDVTWPADEPYWKRQIYNIGEMFMGAALAYMLMKNHIAERSRRRDESLDKLAKINLMYSCKFTGEDDENRRVAGESD
jgi:hypothetical protein